MPAPSLAAVVAVVTAVAVVAGVAVAPVPPAWRLPVRAGQGSHSEFPHLQL